jgi:tetratricopeptide (TPR) repeat protein
MKRDLSIAGPRTLRSRLTLEISRSALLAALLLGWPALALAEDGVTEAGEAAEAARPETKPPVPPRSRQEAELLLRRADDAYLDGRFDEAARVYRAVAEGGYGSADVWFNLGNAAWQAGRVGEAVVGWERALRRDPRHEDARANLRLAREQVVDRVVGAAPPPALERIGARLPAGRIAWGLAGAWLLMAGAVVLRRRAKRRRTLLALVASAGLLGSLALASLTAVVVWYHEAVERAVVVKPVVQVRSGPAPRFDPAFEIHEGLVVRVVDRDGPYLRVRLDNGRSGWVLRRSMETI